MILKSDAKFKEKLTCGFKHNMRNLLNFHQTTLKSKNFTLMGYFCPKYMMFELKKIKRSYLPWHWTVYFHLSTQKFGKLYNDGLFLFKACNVCFSYEVSEEFCVITLKGVAKFKGKLTCGLKNDIRNLVNFHASNQKSEL